MDTRIRIDWG